MLFSILAAVGDFAGDRAPEDDLAILVVQHVEGTGAESMAAAS